MYIESSPNLFKLEKTIHKCFDYSSSFPLSFFISSFLPYITEKLHVHAWWMYTYNVHAKWFLAYIAYTGGVTFSLVFYG